MTAWLGEQPIVRCMPNTPALLRQGVSGLYATSEVSAEQRQQAEELLSAVGIALWLNEEQLLDAVTAVSGSGPAYFFLLIEAMTAAGVKLGLPKEIAEQLTLQTALGAAHMAVASDVDAAELRQPRDVASRHHGSCNQIIPDRGLRSSGRKSTRRRRAPLGRNGRTTRSLIST
jgi:pyrroline-5-carboxylate reductase